ncbi:MAG: heparinase II/III family protein, partial [Gammaproteobacteria bacterium]|nr:heparinase II/III family protein [Gammaproteobacteria bacterium]
LKNGKALVFAGACLTGPAARGYLARGLDIVLGEADEQIMADGGHVERSPLYHAIALEDYLDLVNLLGSNPGLAPPGALATLGAAAGRALGFLDTVLDGRGAIPLFNDAAFGIAPPPAALLAYGRRVLGAAADGSGAGVADASAAADPGGAAPFREFRLPDSGYYGYRQGGESLIVDCGAVGPDYQPGHAHCDTLSFQLCVAGQPVVVDSGTFDYEPGALRHYLRSTAAHSTLRIDGAEQSEIWGQFRVARRARPLSARWTTEPDGARVFRGSHDGYTRLKGAPVHTREIQAWPGRRWAVRDAVAGRGRHRLESFLHLHPDIGIHQVDERNFILALPAGPSLRLGFGPGGVIRRARGYYCPEFGVRLACGALVHEIECALPARLEMTLELQD